jgi:hypothetical protein
MFDIAFLQARFSCTRDYGPELVFDRTTPHVDRTRLIEYNEAVKALEKAVKELPRDGVGWDVASARVAEATERCEKLRSELFGPDPSAA